MVTESEPLAESAPATAAPRGPGGGSDEPVGTLRGAGVGVDVRRVGRVAVGVCLVALAVLVIVLFVAGWKKNAQITRLHQHGVPVTVTVTGCTGLLGGSGSNPVGYACRGTFTVGGRRYGGPIPGNVLYPPGATLRAVTVPSDPSLMTPVGQLAREHPSGNVFVLPTILVGVLALLVTTALVRRHRARG
jgi:hypothetical protein